MKNGLEYPVLLGRLYNDEECAFLRSNFDEIVHIHRADFLALKSMDGFLSFAEIAEKCDYDEKDVKNIFDKYAGDRILTSLYEWNTLNWCDCCHTYVSDSKCGICGIETKKIVFSPPCDPTMCFCSERNLINKKAKELGVVMPSNAFYIINTGVQNRKFYWEIAYGGKVVFRIDFEGERIEDWKMEFLIDVIDIAKIPKMLDSPEELRKIITANYRKQKKLVGCATEFIEYTYGFFDSKPLLYFSAGKESMVIYSLLKQMDKSANVLTVTTGIDIPEDYQFMKQMKEVISQDSRFTHYFFENDGNEAIQYLNRVGKLSIADPWCRLLIKKKQKNMGTEHIYHGESFVALEGTRWYETNFRRSNPKINILKEYPNQIWASPIIEWTSFDVWIYLLAQGEPINPVYSLGFQRTTCWLCPAVSPFSIYLSKQYYPELWSKIKDCELDAFVEKDDKDVIY